MKCNRPESPTARQLCRALVALLVFGLGASSCASLFGGRSEPCADTVDERYVAPTSTVGSAVTALVAAGSWGYQLQQISPDAVAASGHELFTVDYSADGSAAGAFTRAEVQAMQSGGALVVAYLSIGEAEDYRFYFDDAWLGLRGSDAPCWLGRTNRDWPGNYKVQYWSTGWQNIVLAYLDQIVDAGFDGVYLDIVDACSYWSDEGNRDDFLVIPQNGEEILDHDPLGPARRRQR